MPRERAGAAAPDAEPAFIVGGSLVIDLVESKGALLMMVFKQSQVANSTNITPRRKNQAGGVDR